jgi:phosphoenolpyruvate carboxykinase (ATP)
MVASPRPGSPFHGRPVSSSSTHTKVEEELHDVAGIDYDKVKKKTQSMETMRSIA